MKRIILVTIFFCFVCTIGIAQSVDAAKSLVTFKISNIGINTVKGTFGGMKGAINFSPNNLSGSNFDVCIDANTINTKNSKRDEHLRTADFFDTKNYPTICFKSTNISKTATGYVAVGSLSLHGITKEVKIPFTFSDNVFKGALQLKRLDYKIGANTGTFMVGNEVGIEIVGTLNQ